MKTTEQEEVEEQAGKLQLALQTRGKREVLM